jgi:hypothetical protein
MTFTEEFENQELAELDQYPTAFGITFTPRNSGIAAGVLGLLGSFYLLFNWVMPAYNTLQQLQNDAGWQTTTDQINKKAVSAPRNSQKSRVNYNKKRQLNSKYSRFLLKKRT